jgi:hypothetical protein
MDSIASRVGELVIVIRIWFLVDTLGSLSKDSHKMVATWLVRIIGSVSGSAVAQAGVMPIGCGLKGNCGGVS